MAFVTKHSFLGKNSSQVVLTTLFFCALSPQASNASPWPQPHKRFLLISRTDYFNADLGKINTINGLVEGRFQKTSADLYLEYGLTQKITLGGKIIYSQNWLSRGNNVERANGFSEIEIFGQYNLLQTTRGSGSVKVAITKPSDFQSGQRPGLQSRGYDVTASVLYGHNISTDPVKIFATIETGFKKRFSDSSDQIEGQATLGIEPSDKWLFLLDTFATKSLKNEKLAGADFDIVKVQPSIVWRPNKRWSLQAGVTQEIAGRNLSLGRTFFFSLWSAF
ncbi:MAG: hypothetical protein DHS20C05_12300 [Hyphococcus sp.]|nr:MAG: hypothetical protein DHS20C05_12300 [Marinicaulis sp.]